MSSRLTPYLGFAGEAREALEFYAGVFGGTPRVTTYGEYGDPGAPGAAAVMHGVLETPAGYTIMVSDAPPGSQHTAGSSITVSLFGDDAEQLRGYWQGLAEGATVSVPLATQVWGDEFGMLVDRFGTPWMVNVSAPDG